MTHRALWVEAEVSKRLGPDGYKWFLERAKRYIANCQMCKGTATVSVPNTLLNEGFRKRDGTVTNYTIQQACSICLGHVELLEQFVYAYHYFVPPAYRWCILSQLTPYEGTKEIVPLERQQAILDMLRAEPEGSYMLFGPAHCGETVWTTALFIQSLWLHYMRDGRHRRKMPIQRISAKKLLDQHTDYAMRRYEKDDEGFSVADEPDVTAEKIIKLRRDGHTFKLYLEEIDKIAQTDSRRNNLFDIVNTLHEQEGVLVLNSNLRPEEFAVQFGEDFAWRIGKKCKTINLFDAK